MEEHGDAGNVLFLVLLLGEDKNNTMRNAVAVLIRTQIEFKFTVAELMHVQSRLSLYQDASRGGGGGKCYHRAESSPSLARPLILAGLDRQLLVTRTTQVV